LLERLNATVEIAREEKSCYTYCVLVLVVAERTGMSVAITSREFLLEKLVVE